MSQEKKEIIHDATRQAKLAVDDARETVQHSLAELNQIQQEIERKRAEHNSPDHAEVKALESRMRELQLHMTRSVEDASKQVQQVTSDAKGKLGIEGNTHAAQPAASGGAAGRDVAAPVQHSELQEEGASSTPTSARASQGIVGGFMFRSNRDDESDESDDDSSDDSDAGPTARDVTSSIDEAQESAQAASQGNRSAVERAASDVKESIKKDK